MAVLSRPGRWLLPSMLLLLAIGLGIVLYLQIGALQVIREGDTTARNGDNLDIDMDSDIYELRSGSSSSCSRLIGGK